MTQTRVIQLPADLCAAVEKKLGQRFASLEDLLVYVLRDLTCEDASEADLAEQHIVEERLRDLGYI